MNLYPNAPSGSEVKIDVFGVCGEYKSGKTLLGLSIAPGKHEDGQFVGQARTLVLDFEKSSGTYGGTGAERIDVHDELIRQFPAGYTSQNVYLWFLNKIKEIQPNQYDVIMVDTITDIETGMVDYLKANCEKEVGITRNQMTSSSGLFWGAVKDKWKLILLQLSTKCQTFFFTAHLRSRYTGNTPVKSTDIRKAKEAKGKDTLLELSSLYLWLDRSPDRETGKYPKVPRAWVQKDRLADTTIDAYGDIVITPLLPPTMEEATIKQLRKYISTGFNYDGASKLLKAENETFTDDDKLIIQREIEEQKAIAAQAELEREQLINDNLKRRNEIVNASAKTPAVQEPAARKIQTPTLAPTGEPTLKPALNPCRLPPEPSEIDLNEPDKGAENRVPFVPDEPIEDYRQAIMQAAQNNALLKPLIDTELVFRGKMNVNKLTDQEAEKIYSKVVLGTDINDTPF